MPERGHQRRWPGPAGATSSGTARQLSAGAGHCALATRRERASDSFRVLVFTLGYLRNVFGYAFALGLSRLSGRPARWAGRLGRYADAAAVPGQGLGPGQAVTG